MMRAMIVVMTAALVGVISLGMQAQPDATGKAPTKPAAELKGDATPTAQKDAGNSSNPMASMPEYKRLASQEGTWDVVMKFWFQPGAEVYETKATMVNRMVLGGLFLEQRSTGGKLGGEMGGMPMEMLSLVGYDMSTKKYTATPFSSSCPVPIPLVGGYDEATKSFTLEGTYKLMYMEVKERDVVKILSDDEHVVECYLSFNNGPEWKGIELVCKRKK